MRQDINADWARNEANAILGAKVIKEIDECNEAIKFAVQKNEMMTFVSIYAHPRTIKDLEMRGFRVVQHDDQREGSSLQINW